MHERMEEALDGGPGSCFMRNPRVAEVVANAIKHFDDDRYRLCAWCVMPNHVHVVIQTFERIDDMVHSWKSYSSKQANRILRREGKFWQDDYFDRMMRSPEDLQRTTKYVLDNPLKAGLQNWRWLGERASRPQSPAVPAGD